MPEKLLGSFSGIFFLPVTRMAGILLGFAEDDMAKSFSTLEKNILKTKGLSDAQIGKLAKAGVSTKDDLRTVGDADTLAGLVKGISAEAATAVMAWAGGQASASGGGAGMVVESPEVVNCVHCKTKQPKDYKSGDLCTSCGKQAEPILSCYWCSASGPGKFCRSCGAEFVGTAELDLAVHLKREGQPKDAIPAKLRGMSAAEKEVLWGKIRRARG